MKTVSDKILFSKRLRGCMNGKSETIYTLGAKIGMAPTTISSYLQAISIPKLPTLKALSEILGVNGFWLTGVPGFDQYTGIQTSFKRVPILGRVAAGTPITAIENIEGYEVTDASDKTHFCLRVKGDSMQDAHIPNGSIVYCVIATEIDVVSGNIAIVLVDDEDATVKRIVIEDGGIYLIPANSSYTPKFYKKSELKDIKILAKVIACKIEM